ncbi:MAG TPA: hypothetical protein VID30_07285 [Bradyrhizobium sp.]|jgi:hypothetical protein
MTTGARLSEFGKRQPARLPDTPPPKRSSHVALLVMGTLAVGGGAYALTPRDSCTPPAPAAPGMAAPALPQTGCATRSSSGGGGGGGYSRSSSGFSFFGGDSSSHGSSAGGTESSSGVSRGGFGSFAHAFGFGGG